MQSPLRLRLTRLGAASYLTHWDTGAKVDGEDPIDMDSKDRRAARSFIRRPDAGASPLSPAELQQIDAHWRASNYLAVGQIYLFDNPLLREPLAASMSNRACSGISERRRG